MGGEIKMTEKQKTVIVVDDNDSHLTACKKILKPYYAVYPVLSAAKMFDLLNHVIPHLILMDVEMPDTNGYEAVRMLKNSEAFKKIPIIFLTARNDSISEMEGLNLGALDYIHKPFVSSILLRRLELHLALIDYQVILEEQNRSKDILISRILQEIRSPLNSILDTVHRIVHGSGEDIKDNIGVVNDTVQQILETLDSTSNMINAGL
jgi:putative two-component system response regulator